MVMIGSAGHVCGIQYTYSSGPHFTTTIATQDLVQHITCCTTLEEHELNTSDHLPITLTLSLLADVQLKIVQSTLKPKKLEGSHTY